MHLHHTSHHSSSSSSSRCPNRLDIINLSQQSSERTNRIFNGIIRQLQTRPPTVKRILPRIGLGVHLLHNDTERHLPLQHLGRPLNEHGTATQPFKQLKLGHLLPRARHLLTVRKLPT